VSRDETSPRRIDIRRYTNEPSARIGTALRELRRQIGALREHVLWPPDHLLDISQQDTLEVLVLLYPNGAPINIVAEVMRIDASTTSRILDRLVARGLVRKSRSKVDSRQVVVSVTARGSRAFAQSFWPARDRHDELLRGTFSAAELRQLSELLVRLVGAYDAAIDHSLTGQPERSVNRPRPSTRPSSSGHRS
jgi:DNA-binding MarR family transcriptional regulator